MGGRCTGDLYRRPWAGVDVCCCGHAVDTSVPGASGFSFFPVSVCGLGMEGFGKNLGSVVIGVFSGPWAAESWYLSMCISPSAKFRFLYWPS